MNPQSPLKAPNQALETQTPPKDNTGQTSPVSTKPIKEPTFKSPQIDIIQEIENNLKGQRIKGFEKTWPYKWKAIKGKNCEVCGESRYLEKCHIIPRRFDWFLVKWDLLERNTLILCPNCHKYFDNDLLKEEEKAKIANKVKISMKAFMGEYEKLEELKKKVHTRWLKQLIQ